MRTVYAVGTEFRPLARATGLAEFGGLLAEIAGRNPTLRVRCLLPRYRGMNAGRVGVPSNLEFLSVGPEVPGVEVTGGRIQGSLPGDHDLWEQFSNEALSVIRSEKQGFGLLALDWPTGRLVATLKQRPYNCAKVTFTVDLVPGVGELAYELWLEGVASADTVHLPSDSWREHLRHTPHARPLFANEAKLNCIRYGFDATCFHLKRKEFGYSEHDLGNRRLQKQVIQDYFGLRRDADAMLVIAVNRWSKDDQKNNRLIARYARDFLQLREGQIHLIIGNTSLQYKDERLKKEFLAIAKECHQCLAIGGMKWENLLAGVDLQLLPSRYEPCGLNHCQGMSMGVIPLCSRTGCMGAPPMADGQNAFLFDWDDAASEASSRAYFGALCRAVDRYFSHPYAWQEAVQQTMKAAFEYEWSCVVREYEQMICGNAFA